MKKNIYLIIITIITVVCIIAGSLYHIGGFALDPVSYTHLSFNYTMILLIIPVLSICMLLSKPILYLNINLPSTYFILAAFVLFINFMNYILLYNVLDTEELRFQLAVQKEQLEFQRSKYQQLGEAYKNIRSFMHDTKKHLF